MKQPGLEHYESGISYHLDYPDLTLPAVLHQTAEKYPQHTSMVYQNASWSYTQLNDLVSQMANFLINRGVQPGDRVGIQLPNSPQFIIAYYGTLRAGAIAVPINPQFKGDDLTFLVDDSALKAVVTCVEILPVYKDIASKAQVIVTDIKTPFSPSQEYTPSLPEAIRLEQHLFSCSTSDPQAPITSRSIATLQYTGGTTGRSKGAVLTHFNLLANVIQFREWFKNVFQDGDGRFVAVIPLFHIYGLTTSMNVPVYTGSSMLLMPKFDLNELMALIDKHRPNLFMGVPAMYGAIAARENHNYDLSSIEACVSGSAPLPPAIQDKFQKLTGGKLVEGYGLSEASPIVAVNPIYGTVKTGSIGLPFPDTEVRIVDPQTGEIITAPERIGELVVKGPQVMQGYWQKPDETALVLKDGWLHTGDLVKRDADGYLYIADRLKDMIIMGGEKIYPREIEDLLYTHPAVKEVAVIGVPHELRGEVPQAFVVLKEGAVVTEKELKQFCSQHLSKFKVPHKVSIVDALPRSSVGKVLRRLLKEQFEKAI